MHARINSVTVLIRMDTADSIFRGRSSQAFFGGYEPDFHLLTYHITQVFRDHQNLPAAPLPPLSLYFFFRNTSTFIQPTRSLTSSSIQLPPSLASHSFEQPPYFSIFFFLSPGGLAQRVFPPPFRVNDLICFTLPRPRTLDKIVLLTRFAVICR